MREVGRWIGVEIKKENVGKNQTGTLYSYTLTHGDSKRFYSGFKLFDQELFGEEVDVEFTEQVNPNNDKFPYRTIREMIKAPVLGSIANPITPENLEVPKSGTGNLLSGDPGVMPTPEESKVMDELRRKVDPRYVTEEAFVVTLMENGDATREKAKSLFTVYQRSNR